MAILRIPKFWQAVDRSRPVHFANAAGHGASAEPDGLDAFGSETMPALAGGLPAPAAALKPGPALVRTPAAAPVPESVTAEQWLRAGKWAAVIVVTAGLAVASVITYQRKLAPKPTTGSVLVETVPANLEVFIAGASVGRTPLTLSLPPGMTDIQVGPPEQRRTITTNVAAGVASVQHIEFVAQQPTLSDTGTLRVQTEPSKLPVLVDGVDRGFSPITIERLSPGDHDVAVRTDRGLVRKKVTIQARESMSLIVSGVSGVSGGSGVDAGTTAGWLNVSSPVPMQLREDGKVIGTTESERVMLPAGEHDIEIVNEALGFRVVRKMRVAPGKTANTRIELPNGTVSLNAQPWAEVWIDGERVGETPIGNLQRPIGPHQVVFRHPDLGERRESVLITLLQPARLGVDLRKK